MGVAAPRYWAIYLVERRVLRILRFAKGVHRYNVLRLRVKLAGRALLAEFGAAESSRSIGVPFTRSHSGTRS